jgi:myo-inositol-1(or 4)-monophosphatase
MSCSEAEAAAYLEFACRAARLAGERILPHFRRPVAITNKGEPGDFDPVTAADRAAEAVIREEIAKAFPTHGIVGEEHGTTPGDARFTWVIDPIDGTRSFILGQLHWGTLIALNEDGRPLVGVVHQPFVGETFVGFPGGAEWRRGDERRRLATRACPRLDDAAVSTTHPGNFASAVERAAFDLVAARARLVRYGGDCYAYCLLAMGLVDVVIESGLFPYDVQAIIPIVEGAGGVVTDWAGGPADRGGQVIAAGDRTLHRALLEILAWGRPAQAGDPMTRKA